MLEKEGEKLVKLNAPKPLRRKDFRAFGRTKKLKKPLENSPFFGNEVSSNSKKCP